MLSGDCQHGNMTWDTDKDRPLCLLTLCILTFASVWTQNTLWSLKTNKLVTCTFCGCVSENKSPFMKCFSVMMVISWSSVSSNQTAMLSSPFSLLCTSFSRVLICRGTNQKVIFLNISCHNWKFVSIAQTTHNSKTAYQPWNECREFNFDLVRIGPNGLWLNI